MADERTIREIEYLVSVQGATTLTDLQGRLAAANRELARATAEYAAGRTTVENYHKAVRDLLAAQADLAQRVVVTDQVIQNGGKALQDTSQNAAAAGRAFLEFGRAAEDFSTAGFLGVINNIPTMLGNVGTAAGLTATSISLLTGGIAIAGAAAYTLYRNWDSVAGVFQTSTAAVELEVSRLEELENVTKRTAAETKELNRLKKEQAEIDRLMEAPTKREEAVAKMFRESVAESAAGGVAGGERLARLMAESRLAQAPGGIASLFMPAEVQKIREAGDKAIQAMSMFVGEAGFAPGEEEKIRREATEEAIRNATANAERRLMEESRARLAGFERDPDAFFRMMQRDPGRFGADTLERFRDIPWHVEQEEKIPRLRREADERRDRDRETDRLNREAQQAEAFTRQKLEREHEEDARNAARQDRERTADDLRNLAEEEREKQRQAREAAKFERDAPKRRVQQLAGQAERAFGLDEQQALAVAERGYALNQQGLNINQAMLQAYMDLANKQFGLMRAQAALANNFRQAVRQMQARGGHRNPNQ